MSLSRIIPVGHRFYNRKAYQNREASRPEECGDGCGCDFGCGHDWRNPVKEYTCTTCGGNGRTLQLGYMGETCYVDCTTCETLGYLP